jgi:hypothetical protein
VKIRQTIKKAPKPIPTEAQKPIRFPKCASAMITAKKDRTIPRTKTEGPNTSGLSSYFPLIMDSVERAPPQAGQITWEGIPGVSVEISASPMTQAAALLSSWVLQCGHLILSLFMDFSGCNVLYLTGIIDPMEEMSRYFRKMQN